VQTETLPQTKVSSPETSLRHDVLRAILLLLAVVVCWCYVTGRTGAVAWQVPLEYGVSGADADALFSMSLFKAGSEGEVQVIAPLVISRLGAPYKAVWSDFPIPEKFLFWFTGLLARWIGLFAAANFAVLAAQALAAVCFYAAARMLGCKWWWALAGGFAFGFAQFALARSIHHIGVTHFWHIPLGLVVAAWVTRGELGDWRGWRFWFAMAVAVLTGTLNVYYTNMFLQLVILGAFYQYFRQGWKPVRQAGAIVAASAGGFLFMTADTFVYHFTHGSNPGAAVRPFMWLEIYGLKFVDMLIPPPNHSLLDGLGRAYYKAVALPCEVPPSCYLGILGVGALVWLIVVSVRRLVLQPGRNLPMEAWQVLWILAYSAIGGLNCLMGVFGFTLFRSTTRYSIFILPIVLLFALRRLSKMRLEREVAFVLAALAALVAFWDQTPSAVTPSEIAAVEQVVHSDRVLAQTLEARLPKGAMVFQLPIVEFPESPAPGISGYDHLRLYLHTHDLRFAFGGMKGRPWQQWQRELGQKPSLAAIVQTLESYGFSALYVNRAGFPDKGAGILKGLADLGYGEVLHSDLGDIYVVLLRPSANPVLPHGPIRN